MAIVNVSFNCGCGEQLKTTEEAAEHADRYGHALTAQGTIQPAERKAKPSHTLVEPRTRASKLLTPKLQVGVTAKNILTPATEAEVEEASTANFSGLRARVGGRKAK